jgi:hypothetical protein
LEAAGIEPSGDFAASGILPSGCVICEECRAARALQNGCSTWLELSSLDADLQSVHAAWATLPDAIRKAILSLAEIQSP